MSNFARRIRYCAGEMSFVALLEISNKKFGKIRKHVLYRYSIGLQPEQIECKSLAQAKKLFPYGIVYEEKDNPPDSVEAGPFGKTGRSLWENTTRWLYDVAVGGGCGLYPEGTWVKVGRPGTWKKRRKKFIAKFGELGHILLAHEERLDELEGRRMRLEGDLLTWDEEHEERMTLGDFFGYRIERFLFVEDVDSLKEERDGLENGERELLETLIQIIEEKDSIKAIKDEMRFKKGNNVKNTVAKEV